jgi:hypothetical protein
LPVVCTRWGRRKEFLDGCEKYLAYLGAIFPSGSPSVVMMQTTKNWNANDGVMGLRLIDSVSI